MGSSWHNLVVLQHRIVRMEHLAWIDEFIQPLDGLQQGSLSEQK